MPATLFASVDKETGKVILDHPGSFALEANRHRGRRIQITIGRYYKKRTDRQNRGYWGVYIEYIREELGYSKKDIERLHHWIKSECWYEVKIVNGKEKRIPKDTHSLNTQEFSNDFMFVVKDWAFEDLGIILPDPEQARAMAEAAK